MKKDPQSNTKLRIAFVSDGVTERVGGSFISTLRFAERLHARGHEVIFIAARTPEHPKNDSYNGIRTYRFSSVLSPKTDGRLYIGFARPSTIKRILEKEKIDVLHVTNAAPLMFASIKAARRLHIPIVAHSDVQAENITLQLPAFAPKRLISRLFHSYLAWLYRKADALVYPSAFAKRYFPELNALMETHVVSNGVDTKQFVRVNDAKRTAAWEKLLARYTVSPHKKRVLYVGRLQPEKSIDTLIRAVPRIASLHPDAQVFIAGAGHSRQKLEDLARELDVRKNVTFLGRISDEELLTAYNMCDVFVLPSAFELEGMVVLEAMSCGKPVVVADSEHSASTALVDGNGFLFRAGDQNDLASKVDVLLKDTMRAKRMGEKSYAISRAYDIEESVSQLECVYAGLIDQTSRTRTLSDRDAHLSGVQSGK